MAGNSIEQALQDVPRVKRQAERYKLTSPQILEVTIIDFDRQIASSNPNVEKINPKNLDAKK